MRFISFLSLPLLHKCWSVKVQPLPSSYIIGNRATSWSVDLMVAKMLHLKAAARQKTNLTKVSLTDKFMFLTFVLVVVTSLKLLITTLFLRSESHVTWTIKSIFYQTD